MEEKKLKFFQNELLEIGKTITKICDENNIKYSMIAGTLLGAVRHKGFIPWDDDFDIGMPRDDYERFLKIASKELPNNYIIQNINLEKNYGLIFSKVVNKNIIVHEEYSKNVKINHGIWVDIFPFDNLPNDIKKAKFHYKKVKFLDSLLTIKLGYKCELNSLYLKFSYIVIKIFTFFIPKNSLKNYINKQLTKYNNVKSNYIISYGSTYSFEKDIQNYNLFKELIEFKFKNVKFYGFKNYDKYLSKMYGEYMKLPPKEEREHHILDFEIKK